MFYTCMICKINHWFNIWKIKILKQHDDFRQRHYTHKDAYMIGAGLIIIGKAEEIISLIENEPKYKEKLKIKKQEMLKRKKAELEKELKDL